jgi:hypothetical protein
MPTWSTATDWDNATSESGVVHENSTNTDHDDATIVKQGYSAASPYLSANLTEWWPLHEDSGSTIYGVIGNNDGTLSGGTLGRPGLLGTTGIGFDGSDDIVDLGSPGLIQGSSEFTVIVWANLDSASNRRDLFAIGDGSDSDVLRFGVENGNLWSFDGTDLYEDNGVSTGSTEHYAIRYSDSGGNRYHFVNGTKGSAGTTNGSIGTTSAGTSIGAKGGGPYSDGDLFGVWVFDGYALTDSEIQTHYEIATAQSSLTTATKQL